MFYWYKLGKRVEIINWRLLIIIPKKKKNTQLYGPYKWQTVKLRTNLIMEFFCFCNMLICKAFEVLFTSVVFSFLSSIDITKKKTERVNKRAI